MEQGGRSSGESERNQQQRRMMKMPENISQPPPQPPPPQKCPRCDSNNTKFCYYNNYSLSQPRYFCKTCRRYWTQGGTLRNVPVGGGCRKGKRTMKAAVGSSSSAGESSSRSHHHHQQQQRPPQIENLSAAAASFFSGNNCSRSQPPTLPSVSSLYTGGSGIGGGGFLSSLAAIQSMTQLSQGVNNQSQLGLINSGGSNNQFSDFNIPNNTPPKVQINQQMESGFYHMVNREKPMESSIYPTDETLQYFQPTRPLGTWTQRFINNNYANVWPNNSVSSSSSGGANNSTPVAGASLSPNHWPDLPGFGPSP